MIILTIFAILCLALTITFWAGSSLLQAWLYNDSARLLPVRALIAALFVGGFLTIWANIYRNDPGRIDTLHHYKRDVLVKDVPELTAIRKVREGEERVPYVRVLGARPGAEAFRHAETGKFWSRSDSDGMVIAVEYQQDGGEKVIRLDALLEKDGNFPSGMVRFREAGGKQFMDEASLGSIYRRRPFGLIVNLFANLLHVFIWVVALFPVMRFNFGHACGMGVFAWFLTMVVVQPFLFELATGN